MASKSIDYTSAKNRRFVQALVTTKQPYTTKDLAAAAGLARTTDVSNRMRIVIADGLASADSTDRLLAYSLTPKGEKLLAKALKSKTSLNSKLVRESASEPTSEPPDEPQRDAKASYTHPAFLSFQLKMNATSDYYASALKQLSTGTKSKELKAEIEQILAYAP